MATLEELEKRIADIEKSQKESSFAWLAPYIPSLKSVLISVISAAIGASGGYVSAPKENVKEMPVNVTVHPQLKDDGKAEIKDAKASHAIARPANEEKK